MSIVTQASRCRKHDVGLVANSVMVWFRSPQDGAESCVELFHADARQLADAKPWRTFRWYQGQRHYSGVYWSATDQAHLIYESRLELARLQDADFDPAVRRIAAQPFLLTATVAGVERRHVPDFLFLTDDGPLVVDVKPGAFLERPKVADTLAWTEEVITQRGWSYQVWSEPCPIRRQNIGFLAGYRRAALFDPALLEELKNAGLDYKQFDEAPAVLKRRPAAMTRAALLHLLWCRHFDTDLDRPLAASSTLRPGAGR